ncbi:MAG: glucose 1-dehydrogenase [Chloroflexi bacterium]|nr:glucose 1-dehydrogenase [Chloroflexota bacterium]
MGIFDGKVALVTGANAGIGLAAARDFASKGASVVIAARREAEGTAAAEQIGSEGGNAIFVKTDVSDEAQVKNMVDQTVSTYGRLDYAFNNAGVLGDFSSFVDGTVENFTNVMDINVIGVFLCMKYEIQAMLKIGGGAIVNNSSIGGQTGGTGAPAYFASKHAVLGLTKSGAKTHGKDGIRVTAVLPGNIQTDMIDAVINAGPDSSDARKNMEATIPQGRLGYPEEIARVVTWLCSDEASYVNGEGIRIDGGKLSI